MKSTKLAIFTLSALLLLSCAKDRPIDTDATDAIENGVPTQKRLAKSAFNENQLWYSKATIVKRSDTTPKKWMFVGSAGNLNLGYFKFNEEELSFFNAVNANNTNEDKHTTDDLLYSWNVAHSEYALKESNGEVKNVQQEDPSLQWFEKNHFFVSFADGQISPRNDIGGSVANCWYNASKRMVPGTLKVSGDHIAFNVQYVYEYRGESFFNWRCSSITDLLNLSPTYTVEIRYSFKPRDKVRNVDYEPYVYSGENDPLMKKYGYFKTRVLSRDEDGIEKITWLMNRWDPRKTHTYYFDADTPENLKVFYTHPDNGIFKKLNDVYANAGLPTRFEIKEYDGDTCQYGDVGCSFVKINTEPHNSSPLGYGPSDADPLTGEIIAGRTMIWTSSMMKTIKQYMHATETYRKTAPEMSTVYQKMQETLGQPVSEWTRTANVLNNFNGVISDEEIQKMNEKNLDIEKEKIRRAELSDAYRFLLPQYTYTRENYLWSTWKPAQPERTHIDELKEMQTFMNNLRDEGILSQNMLKEVEADFNAEIELTELMKEEDQESLQYMNLGQYSGCNGLEDSMIDSIKAMVVNGKSAQDIFNTQFYMVAIHELGHTLNLEHNFYGSADVKNFEEPKPAVDLDGNPVWEKNADGSFKLDANGDKVQLMSNMSSTSVMEYLAPNMEYDEIEGWGPYDVAALTYAYSSGERDVDTDFLFCTHDSYNAMSMCNTWDAGSTPSEIAFSLIDNYEARYPYMNYRYGRSMWVTWRHWSRAWGIMWKLKGFMKMQKATYEYGDMQMKLAYKNYDEVTVREVHEAVQADMKQAVKLSLAFYDALIHQKDADRNFRDTVNEKFGNIEKLGIWPEKVFSMFMLYNNHYIGYNPNEGWVLTSYLDYLDDKDEDLARIYEEVVTRGLVERVDEYADVDLMRYAMYINSTMDSAGTVGSGEVSNLDKAGVQCYRPSTFQKVFGETLGFEDANEFVKPAATLPEYFQRNLGEDGMVNVAALRSNNRIYVTTKQQNPISYAVVADIVTTREYDWALTSMRRGARKLKYVSRMYNGYSGEEANFCQ